MRERSGFALAQNLKPNLKQDQKDNRKVGMFLIRNVLGMRRAVEVLCCPALVYEGAAKLAALSSRSCVSDQQNLPIWFSEDSKKTMGLQRRSLRP
jgi:hypothetical protein